MSDFKQNGDTTEAAKFGRRLKRAREDAHLSQTEVGERLGVHYMTVSRWERGLNRPSGDEVIRMAELYGLDPRYFYGAQEGDSESSTSVSRETAEPDEFVPSADLRRGMPARVVAAADGYLDRLRRAKAPTRWLEIAERHLLDRRYATRYSAGRLTEDDMIENLDVTWRLLSEVLAEAGIRA